MGSEEFDFKQTEVGLIPDDWRILTLSELVLKITKGTTPTTIGGRFVDDGINFVKVESLNDDGTTTKEKFSYIDEETNDLLSRSKLQVNDLLYSIAGTIGRVSIVTEDILPANTNQAVAIIRPNLEKIDLRYLRYALVNPDLKNYLLSKVVHAVQANLSLTEIGNCPIPIPRPKEQQSIAKILSDLDSRIELNHRMSATLEAIGQAVFKRWFVDFEFPNEEGKPYKSYNGKTVDSELGAIPAGWTVGCLGDIADNVRN
jgi:type I restriction enzyme S subunit